MNLVGRASTSRIPQLLKPTSWLANRHLSGVVSTEEDALFQHIQPNNRIFGQFDGFAFPEEFPFRVQKFGPSFYEILFSRGFRQEKMFMEVKRFNTRPLLLQLEGAVTNARGKFVEFRINATYNVVGIHIIRIGDTYSKHVDGSEKYLETKGIKLSTIKILFDYLKSRSIPRQEEFPFEIKNGPEKGTLALRRKCEDDVIVVDVRVVNKDKILEELAYMELEDEFVSLENLWVGTCAYQDKMDEFDDAEAGNEEQVEDIGCLIMKVSIFYGHQYSRDIKLDVFAFPDRIFVPFATVSDQACRNLEGFNTFFKDRGIHADTTNFMMYYLAQSMPIPKQKHCLETEPEPKIFGRFSESQIEKAVYLAR